jgi:outer membrane cobalamin receptor
MTARIGAVLLSAAVLAADAGAAGAQVRDTAAVADSSRVLPLPGLLVTGARAPLIADRVGFAVTTVGPAQLAMRRPPTVAEVLRSVPGAFIDEAAGPGGPTIVRLRGGEEVFTQVLVDGVAINENGGFFDMQGLTLSNVDRVEVARGPQSAVYGSSAVSGVVQLLTRRGMPGPARIEVLAEGGGAAENGGAYRATGSIAGGSEKVRYSAGAGAAYNRGIYDVPHDTRTRDGSLRLDYIASDRLDVSATARWVHVEGGLPVRDPGATRVPLDPNARNERDRLVTSASARFAATAAWTHELRGALYRERFVFDDERDDVPTDGLPFFLFDADFVLDSERQRSTVEYGGALRFGEPVRGTGTTISYGALWQREELDDETSGDFGDGVQALDRDSRAAFGEVALRPVARLDLLAGVRVEAFDGLDAAWTPRGSIVFAAMPGALSLRAAAGRAYKAPNLQEQYLSNPFIESNPDLEPETSTSWEVGADARLLDGALAAGITVFRQRYDNLIRAVQSDTDPGKQINRNLGESLAHGVEWTFAFRPAAHWTVGTEGAWVRTEVVENTGLPAASFPEGEPLPFRPGVVGSAYVETARGPLTLHARATFVGAQEVLTERFSGAREEIDGYTLVGFAANWTVRENVGLYARIDNLLDAEYETAFDRRGIPVMGALGLRLFR